MSNPQTPISAPPPPTAPPLYITEDVPGTSRRSCVPLTRTIHRIITETHEHLLNNPYALPVYAKIASGSAFASQSTLDKVKKYLRVCPPYIEIRDFEASPDSTFMWGFVSGQDSSWWSQKPWPDARKNPQHLHLSQALVRAVEASEARGDHPLHNLHLAFVAITVITYLHEISHAVRFALAASPTPVRLSDLVAKNETGWSEDGKQIGKGHSGDYFEVVLFGGQALCRFSSASFVGNLDHCQGLWLMVDDGAGGHERREIEQGSTWLQMATNGRWAQTRLEPPSKVLLHSYSFHSCRVTGDDTLPTTPPLASAPTFGRHQVPYHGPAEQGSPSPKSSYAADAGPDGEDGEYNDEGLTANIEALSFRGLGGASCFGPPRPNSDSL